MSQSVELSAASRWERLVNRNQFSDVIFRVGEARELMFGHRAILAEACISFRAQFVEMTDQEITIEDIEPETFKELLRYMYADRITVTMENVVDILYGAIKFQLRTLIDICMNFMRLRVTDEDVLAVFESNRRYELSWVNSLCLDRICDNPLEIFDDKGFCQLSSISVEQIALRQVMNCRQHHLLSAIKQWLNINEDVDEEGSRILNMVREQSDRSLICKKMHNLSAGLYHHTIPSRSQSVLTNYTLKIESSKPCSVYGVGICIKSKKYPTPIDLHIAVERTRKGKLTSPVIAPLNRTVLAKPADIHVEEVLFKKVIIKPGVSLCTIQIQITHPRHATLYCYSNFDAEHPEAGLRFASSAETDLGNAVPNGNSCVAYVLYND